MGKIIDLLTKGQGQQEKTYPISIEEIDQKFAETESDTQKRLSNYRTYDKFFKGEQWWRHGINNYKGHKYTNNLCRPTNEKMAALLAGTPPEIHSPPDYENRAEYDIYKLINGDYETKFNRSEAVEKVLRKVLYDENSWSRTMYQGALGGSVFGDTILYHYWDDKEKQIKIENIFPGYFRGMFKSNNYEELECAFYIEVISTASIEMKYGVRVKSDGVYNRDSLWDDVMLRQGGYAIVKHYYDDKYYAKVCQNVFLEEPREHGLPGIPFTHIPNKWECYEPWGASDLKDLVEIQEEFNIATSDEAKVVKLFSEPKIVGKNLTDKDINYLKRTKGRLWAMRKDGDLKPFQFSGNIYPIAQRIQDIKERWFMISGLTPVFWGSVQGSIVTGVAMSGQAAPTMQTIRAKTEMWDDRLEKMMTFVMKMLEDKGGRDKDLALSYKEIFDGNYKIELQWENRMPRDDSIFIANELQKQAARVQSRFTTMKRLGVKSPQDEMALITWQERNPLLMSPESEIQHKILNSQTKWEGMEELLAKASEESINMAQGIPQEIHEKAPEEHIAHAESHISYLKQQQAAGLQIPQTIMRVFDDHIAKHEELAQVGNKQMTQVKPGRTQEGFTGPTPIPETTANMPIGQEVTGAPTPGQGQPQGPGGGGMPGLPNNQLG